MHSDCPRATSKYIQGSNAHLLADTGHILDHIKVHSSQGELQNISSELISRILERFVVLSPDFCLSTKRSRTVGGN